MLCFKGKFKKPRRFPLFINHWPLGEILSPWIIKYTVLESEKILNIVIDGNFQVKQPFFYLCKFQLKQHHLFLSCAEINVILQKTQITLYLYMEQPFSDI